jgi:hypothetical protein
MAPHHTAAIIGGMMDTDSNAISIEQFAQQIAPQLAELLADRMPDSFKAANNLIALAVDPKAVKRNLRALHDAMAAASAAQVKLAADRAAFDEYKATETAALEQQEKSAASVWGTVRSREQAVEARERAVGAREREVGSCPGNQPRNHPDFTPIEGTTITREPERSAVRHDAQGNEFTPGTTITMDVGPDAPAGARVRGRKNPAPAPGA